jgi:L-asparagine permease
LSHKVNFLVVVFGIPILAGVLALGWKLVKPAVVENTGDRLKPVWSDDGPTYGPGVSPDDLDVAEHDPALGGEHPHKHGDDGKDSR